MLTLRSSALAALALVLAAGCATRAADAGALDDAALRAYAARPWDKAKLMNTTVRLGTHHGVPVVAEFPCSDVCPQYTVRIIHYELPAGADCRSAGGVEQAVGVPVAIAMMTRTFCFPKVLVEAKLHYVR
ncbi:hypothetical protein [Fulvimonas soli]|jgi:hypothetical protein|uniref:Lipoprotein n=1 Tax=Fulvimonas soli TaxID=155197 RepID=A0A316HSF4_9GAMM|nr:hypothetical protein [Fulvimonas soli]PWK83508.1 hypothetical protein C7456_11341 [Fulvimonas soli]TNY25514.1 hypothetical protein BV497_13550 [Fulvimonas soli]